MVNKAFLNVFERKTRIEPKPMMPKQSQITSPGTLSTFHIDNSDRTTSYQTTITNAPRTTIAWREVTSMVTKLTQVRGHHYFAAKWFVKGADGEGFPKRLYMTGVGMPQFYKPDMVTGRLAQGEG